MRKICPFLFLILGLCFSLEAAPVFVPFKYWISFTDKQASPYSIDQPEAFLSARSVQRRQLQGIAVTEADLPVNPAYVQDLAAQPGVRVFYASRWFNGVLISVDDTTGLPGILQLPFVQEARYVKPHVVNNNASIEKTTCSAAVKNGDPPSDDASFGSFKSLYPLFDYGLGRRQVELVNGQVLHQAGYHGRGKIITVLDSGFLNADKLQGLSHLYQNNQILGVRDFVDSQANIYATHNHGTVVLSVMGTSLPGGLLGTARGADYFLIRTEDAESEFIIEEYNWLAGAELADSLGADIINSSLGYSTFDDPSMNYSYQDLDGRSSVTARAANMAFERGILVVNSAGNSGAQAWRYIGTPADSFGAMAIGAVDTAGVRVQFSSVGPSADGRIKPDVMAQGTTVVVETPSGALAHAAGTSFSSPIIAGMAACLWEKHPGLPALLIRRAIQESSSRIHAPDFLMGYGIPDFALADQLIMNNFVRQDRPLVLFPNPFSPNSELSFYSPVVQLVNLEIFDALGRLVAEIINIPAVEGFNRIQPFTGLGGAAQGIYLIRLSYLQEASPVVLKAIKSY